MSKTSVKVLDQLNKFKNNNGSYSLNLSDLEKIVSNKDITKNKNKKTSKKKPLSAYFLWLNDNREVIRKEYFSDFDNIKIWDRITKEKYYLSKGFVCPDTEGKPRIVSLVTKKAGQLWKTLEDDKRNTYVERAKIMKEEFNISKSFKNNDNYSYYSEEDSSNDEDNITIKQITYNNKTYFHNPDTNYIYDIKTSRRLGIYLSNKVIFS